MKKENENIYDISAIGDMPDIESLGNEERESESSESSENSEDSENSVNSESSEGSEEEDEDAQSVEDSGKSEKDKTSEKDEEDEPEETESAGVIASNLMEAACKILRGELDAEEFGALKDAVYAKMAIEKMKIEMEEAVAEAYRQGEMAGRNAAIEIEADMPEDLVPNLVGTPLHSMRSTEASIFDLARQARSRY